MDAGNNLTQDEMSMAHDRCAHVNFWHGKTLVDGEDIKPYNQNTNDPPPECESFAHWLDAAAGTGKIGVERARELIVEYKDASNRMPPETLVIDVNLTKHDPFGTLTVTPVGDDG